MAFSFASQQQQSPFQFSNQPQQQVSLFSPQPQQWQQPQQQQQLLQQQHQQQQQQLFLFTNDKAPASYSTKWADLHPDSQKVLLQIEERILEYRDESQRLDQCSRLYDSSVSNDTFELDAGHIMQELGGISTSMERQKAALQELMAVVKDMLRNTEVAVRSFMMLRTRFVHPKGGPTSTASATSQPPGATTPPNSANQPSSNSLVPVIDFYSGLPKKPSQFMQQTVSRFEKYLVECKQWVEELEQLIMLDKEHNSYNSASLLQGLPKVMTNLHDFFVHVAAKAESIHQYIESMRSAYLVDQRRRGEANDPFLEADRRETAKLEAASKRVHPTLHLPAAALPQPSTQAVGLSASSSTPMTSTTPQQQMSTPFSLNPSSGSGFPSLLSTPQSNASGGGAASRSSLFSTPTTPQTPAFNFSSSSGLGAPSTTPSLFSGGGGSFAASASSGSSLFSTPFGTGAATGSGSSFGNINRSSRPKPRSSRR